MIANQLYEIVILDRDGVINEDSDQYIKSPTEWYAIPGSLEAIVRLNKAGIKVVIASNQSGIARGLFTEQTLQAIHQKMQQQLAKLGGHIDAIFYCPHHPDDNCTCRKPNPGMLKKIQQQYHCSTKAMLMIGDNIKDIQAAQKFGCASILVTTGKGANMLTKYQAQLTDIPTFQNLAQAVEAILNKSIP